MFGEQNTSLANAFTVGSTPQQGISGPQPHMQLPAHAHKNLDQLTLGAFWMTLANSDAFI
jgi:hypothetical protein